MESSHSVHDIIGNFTTISVQTENSFKLQIYLYNRIYFRRLHLHRDPISTKVLLQLISSPYLDITRMKEKERKRKEKDWAFDVSFFLLSKACPKESVRICGTHHIYNLFRSSNSWILFFFYKNFFNVSTVNLQFFIMYTYFPAYIYCLMVSIIKLDIYKYFGFQTFQGLIFCRS